MESVRLRKIKQILPKVSFRDASDTEKYERCVVCRDITDVPFDTPVSERKCYVPGGGQLCRKCCIELYGTDDLRSLQSEELERMFSGK